MTNRFDALPEDLRMKILYFRHLMELRILLPSIEKEVTREQGEIARLSNTFGSRYVKSYTLHFFCVVSAIFSFGKPSIWLARDLRLST